MTRIFVLIFFSVFFVSCSSRSTLPPVGLRLQEMKQYKNNQAFNTYTMFFSARLVALSKSEKEKNKLLIEAFENFSTGIGKYNVAIWVGKNFNKFDTALSKDLCDKYSVSYTGGPYIVFSRNNPTLGRISINKDVLLDFSNVNSDRIIYILDDIEQKIRKNSYRKIGRTESYKQIVFSKYDNSEEFIKEVVKEIISRMVKS